MNRFKSVLLSLYVALIASPVWAEVKKTVAENNVEDIPLENILSDGTINQGGAFRAIVSLIIVIGLIYITAWVYKKLNVFNSTKLADAVKQPDINKFKVISSQTLGANKTLHVVEINGKYLVIGSTPNNISLIKEFDKETTSMPLEEIKHDNVSVSDLIDKYDEEV